MRHDFRVYYHVSYDDVATDEAIDLILTLPAGSLYCTVRNPRAGWTFEEHRMADIVDLLKIVIWQRSGCPKENEPQMMERPGDREAREEAKKRAHEASEKIKHTKWKEVE